MEEVQIISTSLVGTTSNILNSENNISKIEMTPWDLQFLLLDTIQKGLLFHKPKENTSFIEHIKTSLSRTLNFFPPLSGRFSTVKNADDDTISIVIDCNNAGVEFTHAVAPLLTVSAILESVHVPPIIHTLFPLNNVRNFECVSKPLLGVQVTELIDGYFIGCAMNHSLGDGTCFWHFFNSWSEISRGYEIISKIPVSNRWFPENMNLPIHLPLKLDDEKLFEVFEIPHLKERIFHLSKESIAKLKGKANSEMETKSISSLQAFLAHLWRSVTRCRKLDAKEEVVIGLIIGTRSRLNPPLPEVYFGNAIHVKRVKTTAGELLENGLGWAAMELNKVVNSQNSEEVVKIYKEWAENPVLFSKSTLFVGSKLAISSSPRHNIYNTDFGWGKPVAVRSGMANKSDGKITLFPGVEEGSVDIEICCLPKTLQAMENDSEFMEAVTN
ncbi:uncharacterized acetyltransferase At3g50280-like [Nicotiana sylvestris]|uniref:Uncharacterized acetyltransferase At3g50280-like n=1 Tax=Nicotiana sylvestris TaxID=4096 RepID=A0A1U7WZE1_NICSY|nr:PREDICTED: uncharacterized acetyltransferase At3g50280-like [Nicotiana sylvestris]